jgi:HEPN domain-containing protein
MADPEYSREAGHWLRYAREDLQLAIIAKDNPDAAFRHACYHAQQSAEKAIKAMFIYIQQEFPFTHDLEELRSRLPDSWRILLQPVQLERLTQWVTEARYPSDDEPDAVDAEQAVADASLVLQIVDAALQAHGWAEP